RLGLTIVLITHEMAVIREICDRVAVLEQGRVVELGAVWQVFGAPQAEATLALLRPLVHELPAELAQDLVPLTLDAPLQPDWTVLLELRLTGAQQREFAFGTLARALGGPVELLHGGIDRIQGRPQGRLVLSARTALDSVGTLLQVLQHSADTVAVLGRRTGDAHAA
ncbi:MAG TPA: NIL domain-containing protein, partial [Pseudorhodoferax sp.]|nr:NIL domain-containing protein [Pseudorhodoferax sp.]